MSSRPPFHLMYGEMRGLTCAPRPPTDRMVTDADAAIDRHGNFLLLGANGCVDAHPRALRRGCQAFLPGCQPRHARSRFPRVGHHDGADDSGAAAGRRHHQRADRHLGAGGVPAFPCTQGRSDSAYYGGPVDNGLPTIALRTSNPPAKAIQIIDDVYVSTDAEMIARILKDHRGLAQFAHLSRPRAVAGGSASIRNDARGDGTSCRPMQTRSSRPTRPIYGTSWWHGGSFRRRSSIRYWVNRSMRVSRSLEVSYGHHA